MKILVVEDDKISRKVLLSILHQFGESVAVGSGKEAVHIFQKAQDVGTPFNFVALDVELPDMNGIDVLKKIRDFEKKKGLKRKDGAKIMMVTSHSDEQIVIDSIRAGCNNYIVKPVNRERVADKLKSLGFDIS